MTESETGFPPISTEHWDGQDNVTVPDAASDERAEMVVRIAGDVASQDEEKFEGGV